MKLNYKSEGKQKYKHGFLVAQITVKGLENKRKRNKNQLAKKVTKYLGSIGKCNTYHGPLSQKWIGWRYRFSLWYVMLSQIINRLILVLY